MEHTRLVVFKGSFKGAPDNYTTIKDASYPNLRVLLKIETVEECFKNASYV